MMKQQDPLERELLQMFADKNKKFIYCADAGLGSYHIRTFNSMGGRAFVVTQSVKKLSDTLQEAVFNVHTMDLEAFKKGSHDVTRFIRKKGASKDPCEIDTDKIEKEEKYDGFYAVATNLDDNARDILAVNEQRYKIEDCFRLLKTDFKSRPYFHRKRERIIAHFMICYTALLLYRLLEVTLRKADKSLTARNIIETLQNMQVTNLEEICYASAYTGSRALTALEAVFALKLDRKYYLPGEINKKCKKIYQRFPYNTLKFAIEA